jgi:effector-binding domain-containing protein
MLDTPQVTRATAQAAAVIRLTIPRSQIREAMGPAMGEVLSVVQAQGIGPAGPLFSHHFAMNPETFDFEVGVPVRSPVTPQGRVKPGTLPAAKVARTVYRGPYEGLGAAWGEFGAWIAKQGLTPAPSLWERYVTGPDSGPDSARWQTELNRPLVGKEER